MASPRNPAVIYPVQLLEEHIYGTDAISAIFHLPVPANGEYVTAPEMKLAQQIKKRVLDESSGTLSRYSYIVYQRIDRAEKISVIKAVMKADDEKNETDLDHYAEIFFNYPNYPRLPLKLLKLFGDAGLFTDNPSLLNSLFMLTNSHHVTSGSLYSFAKYLIDSGADVNYRGTTGSNNPNRFTALHLALLNDNDDLACLMLRGSHPFDYRLQDAEGRTVLVLAAKMRKTAVFLLMVQYTHAIAALGITDNEKRNALHYAYLLGDTRIVDALLDLTYLNFNTVDNYDAMPHYLLFSDELEVIRVLNSVSIDERRHPVAKKNYFSLTDIMPINLPATEQLARGLIISKFGTDGNLLTNDMLADNTMLVPILNCGANAEYVKQFRDRLIHLTAKIKLPAEVKNFGDSQSAHLDIIICIPKTLLLTCLEGRTVLRDAMHKPSALTAFSFFKSPEAKASTSSTHERKNESASKKRKR